jgi:hypothetical protein
MNPISVENIERLANKYNLKLVPWATGAELEISVICARGVLAVEVWGGPSSYKGMYTREVRESLGVTETQLVGLEDGFQHKERKCEDPAYTDAYNVGYELWVRAGRPADAMY